MGFDGSIFEKFKKNLNLKSNDINYPGKDASEKNFKKGDIDNYELVNGKNVFDEELNDQDKVRVTLSKKAKSLNEFREHLSNNDDDKGYRVFQDRFLYNREMGLLTKLRYLKNSLLKF